MNNNVEITLNGNKISVPAYISIMEAAKRNGINLPSLCHHPDQRVKAHCRVCVVEVEGRKNLVPSCSTQVADGMVIKTNTARVRETVKTIVELILADHPQECLTCIRNGNCELRQLSDKLGLTNIQAEPSVKRYPIDLSSSTLVRDNNKCIKCGRCAEVCHHVQEVGILYSHNRSTEICISPEYGKKLSEVSCVHCGQCVLACPVGAIYEKDETSKVWDAIQDPEKHVIVQTAPSIRVSIAEEFGLPAGNVSTGKLVSALRNLGFDKIFDTDFAADVTIMEEGNELLQRLKTGGTLPMLTSCSPGWINYIEQYYPELLAHVSSCKSPQQMFGALAKTYYSKVSGIPAEKIFVVSIMPCTAKKYEAQREEMRDSGFQDVDVALTTRELGRMLRSTGTDFSTLPEGQYDEPMGDSTGAAAIFGATGGVMEAALRTVYEVLTGEELKKLEFEEVRGMEGVKSSTVDIAGSPVKVAVAHGLSNAKKILESIKSGKADYTFIEVMCCPGGCIGGGGQPYGSTNARRQERIEALYRLDKDMELRKSHENPAVKKLYDDFLGCPLGETSHKLLHTHYSDRSA
ncbi:MAG: NADH-dependent [FeFe] hydrogenase, group A6 [Spirochaetales bacterium]|nr:NADH-dependent [FeFe] hydrogenase, group A6 [Spirochaetales bacterium]